MVKKTIRETLQEGIKLLSEKNISNSLLEAQLVLAYLLKVDKLYVLINYEKTISVDIEKAFIQRIIERCSGMPLQYIIGKQEFMCTDFFVNKNVLIPRPETEVLVEEVINSINKKDFCTILEIGTGSGCISVSLAKFVEKAKVHTVDISKEALETAKENAKLNGVEEKINFHNGNIFEPIQHLQKNFDIIVSNPPYIPTNMIKSLDVNVKDFEPRIALDGGNDGLDFYRQIISHASLYLKGDGKIFFEIGYNQAKDVCILLKENKFDDIYVIKDLAGLDRVVKGRLKY